MKKNNKILIIFILIFAFTLLFSVKINASDDINPNAYKTTITASEAQGLFSKAQPILTILRGLSVMIAVISISILGIKYMIGSVDQKASYKEKLIPIVIGAILISGLSSILIGINNIMNSSNHGSGGGGGGPGSGHSQVQLDR